MHLLVMRFSAIGDVALSLPVLQAFTEQNPGVKLSVLSRKQFQSMFDPLAVNFISADFHQKHKGLKGLRILFREVLDQVKPDAVIDLHSVLRSHVLSGFFRLEGIPVYRIDKGRIPKKALTRKAHKIRKPLPHTTQRYAKVFQRAGYSVDFSPLKYPVPQYISPEAEQLWEKLRLKSDAIGLAPTAGFPGKAWPLQKIHKLLKQLSEQGIDVLLFGGPEDKKTLHKLVKISESIHDVSGQLNFASEIALIRKLKLMITMDSSNMHLATLAGVPVVSVWGATHWHAGFGPLGDNVKYIAEVPVAKLACRPCSVFGNKPCFRKDYACLNWLEPEDVLNKVILVLHRSSH